MTKIAALWLGIFLLCAPGGLAQKKKDPPTRSVSGTVTTPDNKLAVGAVVQLKDTKTKVVRSFYTVPDKPGEYYFHGLSPDTDYELSATFEGAASGTRTLSVFDSRKDAVIDLKLNPKK
jgi:hypothetical protein